eukprot:TCALIF_11307-PA protein Name:"Similar to pter Phosphotriesterase-related protein (Danio rerio)" AED:0.10 eAED:0.11 QI:190/0.33/0.42/1/1/1/7/0/346
MTGMVTTVLGQVPASALGTTLTHEHLSMSFDVCFVPPPSRQSTRAQLPWTLEHAHWIRQHPYSHADNIVLNDEAAESAVRQSVAAFKAAGGGCLVENSTFGLHRHTAFLADLARDTGVHVVAGTGYYVAGAQTESSLNLSVEQCEDHMRAELTHGCVDNPNVRAGIMGEIGCSFPLHAFERKVVQACAQVQQETGFAVTFHPGRDAQSPSEIMDVFLEAGGTIKDPAELLDLAQSGVYCQFDLFGIENSYYQLAGAIDFPSDAQRMDMIKLLVEHGFEDQILVAHDIHTKHRLVSNNLGEQYGGHGFAHLLDHAIPKMKAHKGFTAETIHKILVDNPARILAQVPH